MSTIMDIEAIQAYLPHRYPFLLLDKVLEVQAGEFIRAVKNVSINEPFFQGHFPTKPVMPGVLVIEAMAQAAGILGVKSVKKELGLPDEPEKDGIYFLLALIRRDFVQLLFLVIS